MARIMVIFKFEHASDTTGHARVVIVRCDTNAFIPCSLLLVCSFITYVLLPREKIGEFICLAFSTLILR